MARLARRPGAAARDPRADGAGPGLHQVRPDPLDPARRGRRRAVATSCAYLQDKLPPFPTAVANATVEEELGKAGRRAFLGVLRPRRRRLDRAGPPRAAGRAPARRWRSRSCGPASNARSARIIDAFYFAARLIETLSPASRRLRPRDVIAHFEGVVMGELDLRLESSSASEFAANTAKDEGFLVPKAALVPVVAPGDDAGLGRGDSAWATSRRSRPPGTTAWRSAERVLQLFLSHALRDGFFHADMHQGNLKVAANGDIIALDFGIMGRIDEYTRRVYAEILIGFIRKDYRRVAEVHFEAGYVPADRDVDEFAQALRAVGEPIFGMDATRISMARLLAYLFEVTERFGMETRTELILLQRTMVVVEGVARSLNPQHQHLAGRAARWSKTTSARMSGRRRWCAISCGPRGCWRGSARACRSWPRRCLSGRPRRRRPPPRRSLAGSRASGRARGRDRRRRVRAGDASLTSRGGRPRRPMSDGATVPPPSMHQNHAAGTVAHFLDSAKGFDRRRLDQLALAVILEPEGVDARRQRRPVRVRPGPCRPDRRDRDLRARDLLPVRVQRRPAPPDRPRSPGRDRASAARRRTSPGPPPAPPSRPRTPSAPCPTSRAAPTWIRSAYWSAPAARRPRRWRAGPQSPRNSIGFSGSWFCICVVSINRKVWKSLLISVPCWVWPCEFVVPVWVVADVTASIFGSFHNLRSSPPPSVASRTRSRPGASVAAISGSASLPGAMFVTTASGGCHGSRSCPKLKLSS